MTNWDNCFNNFFARVWDKRKNLGNPRGFKPQELSISPSDRYTLIKLQAVYWVHRQQALILHTARFWLQYQKLLIT